MTTETTTTVASWRHQGGSTVRLTARAYNEAGAYNVSAFDARGNLFSGGVLYADTEEQAIANVQERIDQGWYSADAWTTTYVRETT